jgi:hypothetical protein
MSTLRCATTLTCLLLLAVASCDGSSDNDSANLPDADAGDTDTGVHEAGDSANLPDTDAGRGDGSSNSDGANLPDADAGDTDTGVHEAGDGANLPDADAGRGDGSSDSDGANLPDADAADTGLCTGPLDEVKQWAGSCAATYEAELATSRSCDQWEVASIGSCEGLHVIVHEWGTHRRACVYEGIGAAALVGAAASNDVPSFCNQTSWDIIGGRVPASCDLTAYVSSLADKEVICTPDAGVHDAGADGTALDGAADATDGAAVE